MYITDKSTLFSVLSTPMPLNHTCAHTHTYAHTRAQKGPCTNTCTHTHTHTRTHKQPHTHTHKPGLKFICTHANSNIIYVHTCTCTHNTLYLYALFLQHIFFIFKKHVHHATLGHHNSKLHRRNVTRQHVLQNNAFCVCPQGMGV